MPIPIPEDDEQRLAALAAYRVLDTAPELRFDRITGLAARLFDVPIALVSLVDEDRQWFKSCIGLDTRQTPRDQAFCTHAIMGDAALVVEDATADARFCDNPLVTGAPDIRFYAGAPLATPSGYRIGTLCIIDRAPRTLSPDDTKTLRDLASLVVDELELRRFAGDLQQRTHDLEQTTATLHNKNRELEQFTYAASHDLRAPARQALMFARILQGSVDSPEDRAKYLDYIIAASTRMQQLLESLLDYARLDGTAEASAVAMSEAFEHAVGSLRVEIEASGAVVTAQELPKVTADLAQAACVLQNLIENALKYRSERTPEIRVSAHRQDSMWRLSVADNGRGIPPQVCDRIFEVFRRVDPSDGQPGTGIGLAMCMKIVERFGGRIWVESKPGEGSTFHFTLPAA